MFDSTFGDIMESLKKEGYEPEIQEDSSFEPFNGKYVARISECGRKKGISQKNNSPYDFISLKLEIVEVVQGDKAVGRRLDKIYSMDNVGVKKFMNDLYTAKIDNCNSSTDEEFEQFLPTLVDKLVNVSAWARPKQTKGADGNWTESVPKEMKQWFKIVATLKLKSGIDTTKSNSVPF